MSSSEVYQPDPDQMWREISPVLDDSLSRLRSRDRDALILRFYQQKSVAEVGAALGVSEGAAKIRILRAVEKLRAQLRRRGITAPAEALSAGLLVHVTHVAPANVAMGCVPTSVSSNAIAISKGVSAMMISAKIKIAAILIVIAAIPLGTGAFLLADRPATAPQPPAASDIAAPAADEDFGFDPRVAPFVKSKTDLLLTVDLTKIDLDAVAADLRNELTRSQMDPASNGRINGIIQMGLTHGRQWIEGFKQSGGTSLYVISRMDDLTADNTGQSTGMKLAGTVVFPTDSPDAATTLARYLTSPGSRAPRVVGSAVVFESSNPGLPQWNPLSDPRSAMAKGLSAAGDVPIVRAAINPQKLGEFMTKVMASGNVPMNIGADEWAGVEYASINIVLPPAQSPGFVIVEHYPDPASAQAAKTKAAARIDQYLESAPHAKSPLSAKTLEFVRTEKFAVKDSDLEATLDLHAYWELIFAAVNGAPQAQRSPQAPPEPANGM